MEAKLFLKGDDVALPRCKQINVDVTRWYHCISRCVRQARLLDEGKATATGDRKQWLQRRLQQLDGIFAVSVGGFAILDNHLHVLLRLDPEVAKSWSDKEVIERWFQLYPPRGTDRKPLAESQRLELVEKLLLDSSWTAERRQRLSSLSWFMKCLKEPLSRMINKDENCKGTFFEGRFKSIAVLDEHALLTVCSYIDLNPVAAGIAKTPEESPYTSVKERVEHVCAQGRVKDLQTATTKGSIEASRSIQGLEDSLWLIPIEDRRRLDSKREGMLEGFTLSNYLTLVDYTGRLVREGKATISAEVEGILQRLNNCSDGWKRRMQSLRTSRWIGRCIACNNQRLQQAAQQFGVCRLINVAAA